MAAPAVPPLLPYLRAIPDPRQPSGRRHPLEAVLALACAAMLAGCDSLLAIAEWGRDPHAGAPLARRLGFTRERTPCVATLHRVFKRLDAAVFEAAVGQWAAAATAALGERAALAGVAVAGKALRGSRRPAVPAVQLLGALGHDLGLVLAEAPIPQGGGEVGALPALLADLVLEGRVVTLDAAFTERPVAEAILAKGGLTCWPSRTTSRGCCGSWRASSPTPPSSPRPARRRGPWTRGMAGWKCAACGAAPRWSATAIGRGWAKRCASSAR